MQSARKVDWTCAVRKLRHKQVARKSLLLSVAGFLELEHQTQGSIGS